MSYIVNKSNGTVLTTIEDGILDTKTSLGLIGKNYIGYGEIQNENFVYLLENFANESPPSRPISGQLWYDSINSKLNVYNGEIWTPVGSATVSATEPPAILGSFWVRTDTQQLYTYSTSGWTLVGPEAAPGFGKTKEESRVVVDSNGNNHAVVLTIINGEIVSIRATEDFLMPASEEYFDFYAINRGENLKYDYAIHGQLRGNATTATRFETARKINGIIFDGQQDIEITSNTKGKLVRGDYILGSDFDGSSEITWSVDASSDNIIGKVVVRDSAGDFSAGKITADEFIGLHKGNVDVDLGISYFDKIVCNSLEGPEFSGNAFSASKLLPGANINGVLFDGSQNITITATAETLTGTRLASNVTESSLTVVGTLNSLSVGSAGISIGSTAVMTISTSSLTPIIKDETGIGLSIATRDTSQPENTAKLRFINSESSLALGGANGPNLIPQYTGVTNLGAPLYKFNNVHANTFHGTATTAQYADLAENYSADQWYEAGTVLMFGGPKEVTLAENNTSRVAGIVSTNPAYLMNSELKDEFVCPIALQGRVPCKILGPVKKGDMLVSAGNGYARSSEDPKLGTIIGKSLVDFDGEMGTIEVVVGKL